MGNWTIGHGLRMILRVKYYKFHNQAFCYKIASDHSQLRSTLVTISCIIFNRFGDKMTQFFRLEHCKHSQIHFRTGKAKLKDFLFSLYILYNTQQHLKENLQGILQQHRKDGCFDGGYKYIATIMKINKESDFTPWGDDNRTIMRIISTPKLKRIREPFKTITHFIADNSPARTPKKPIERALLSLTKIDFYHPPPAITPPETPQKHFSFKYQGPRLNFYLSMNPKQLRLSGEKRPNMKTIERDSLVSTNTSSQPCENSTYRTVQPQQKGIVNKPSYSRIQILGNANNIRRMKEQHKNMRKLKILYHSRALKKQS